MSTAAPRIPVARPDIGAEEQRLAADAVASGWVSSIGPYLERFEAAVAGTAGTAHAAACANGTAALHLALLAVGVGPGDEVVLPALTFVATANAVLHCGAIPVLVDVDPTTLTIDTEAATAAITPRTRALLPVHLYGHPADIDPLRATAHRHDLAVIEDAAEAHGARYRGRPVGSLGDAATFSYFGNKIVTTGEGGAVTTDDVEIDRRVRLLRGQAMSPKVRYWFEEVGFNYRLTNVAAALGCAQHDRLAAFLARRHEIDARYRAALEPVADRLELPPAAPWADPVCWTFTVRIRPGATRARDDIADRLAREGIETRPVFPAIHRLPHLQVHVPAGATFPVSDAASDSGLSLPTSTTMTDGEVEEVAAALQRHLDQR